MAGGRCPNSKWSFISLINFIILFWSISIHLETANGSYSGGLHRIRHHHDRMKRQQGAQLYLAGSFVVTGGEGPDDGPWNKWSVPSECSRSCGGGVATQRRTCQTPNACRGPTARHYSCNTQDCPDNADFRAQQCSEYDDVLFDDTYYRWKPYTKGWNECELSCMPIGGNFHHKHASKVIDGTRCNDESLDVCVDGECYPVGCDMMLGSTIQEDKCRRCGGNGTTCHTILGQLSIDDHINDGYNDLLLIPEGATNIRIEELDVSNNYLAIRNTTGFYYLNGNWRVDYPHVLEFAGTRIHYERYPNDGLQLAPDKIYSLGPINEPLFIAMIYQGSNVSIDYEYSLPTNIQTSDESDSYIWTFDLYGSCSVTCGGGLRKRHVNCAERITLNPVDDTLCDPHLKPESEEKCAEIACEPHWIATAWSNCSAQCGPVGGNQTRQILCQQIIENGISVIISNDNCEKLETIEKPIDIQSCNQNRKCAEWHLGPWKPCDHLCGNGRQTRIVRCHRKENRNIELLSDDECLLINQKPSTEKSCNLRPCEGLDWMTSEWSGCDDKCGLTNETRKTYCASIKNQIYSDKLCDSDKKPQLIRPCQPLNTTNCIYQWYASQWSECSAKCGQGIQTRTIFCGYVTKSGNVEKIDDSKKCDQNKTFDTIRNCVGTNDKCGGEWFSGPWSECSKPCGGGKKERKVVCLRDNIVVSSNECEFSQILFATEECNKHSCNDDDLLPLNNTQIINESDTTTEMITTPSQIDDDEYEIVEDDECLDGEWIEIDSKSSKFDQIIEFDTKTNVKRSLYDLEDDETMLADEPSINSNDDNDELISSGDDGSGDDQFEMDTSIKLESTTMTFIDGASSSTIESSTLFTNLDGTESIDMTTTIKTNDGVINSLGEQDNYPEITEIIDDDNNTSSSSTTEISSSTIDYDYTTNTITTNDNSISTDEMTTDGSTNISTDETTTDVITSSTINDLSSSTTTNDASSTTITTEYDIWTTTESITTTETELTSSSSVSSVTEIFIKSRMCRRKKLNGCKSTKYGCCWDKLTTANGPFGKGCPTPKTCKETKYGCCPDGVSQALDSNFKNCPSTHCEQTLFGCCSDNQTAAEGNANEGCPPDCLSTEWGCCSDNLTAATADGCVDDLWSTTTIEPSSTATTTTFITDINCTDSIYGCCPDDLTSAEGPDFDGCDLLCANTTYGCCPDGVTPAHGPAGLGCCLSSPYGCCPGYASLAIGSNMEGCDCSNTPYGCCPDNLTIARGFHNEGCGCQSSKYGCCPDDITSAKGSNYYGCACNTYQFGCCPDGITYAKGPRQQGCDCQHSVYGCCSDGLTPAKGTNMFGCDCTKSKYGCCLDGFTSATGPDFDGCHEQPTYPQDVCHLTKDNGFGNNYTIKWFYDMDYGGCNRFWYFGDGGNGNRFQTKDDCELICIKPNDRNLCKLPKVYGGCNENYLKWYYNRIDKNCQQFYYSGCLGNINRFETIDECQQICMSTSSSQQEKTQIDKDQCQQEKIDGPCRGKYERWYFDRNSNKCQPFIYGGCNGNGNNFLNEFACEQKCIHKSIEQKEYCTLSMYEGDCFELHARWYFNHSTQECKPFYYKGCNGNGNNFLTRDACEFDCPIKKDLCHLPAEIGDCTNYTLYWYYDTYDHRCRQFYYGGCHGNANRFANEDECQQQCHKTDKIPKIHPNENIDKDSTLFKLEYCSLSNDSGNCDDQYQIRYYYDKTDGACKSFNYSNCGGNPNNFLTYDECFKHCHNAQDLCQLPAVKGECNGTHQQYYYNSQTNECELFIYSGCGGNINRFIHLQDCQSRCIQKITKINDNNPFKLEDCLTFNQTTNCDHQPKYYYNRIDGACKRYPDHTCGTTANNFENYDECFRKCKNVQDFCQLPPLADDDCNAHQQQYYYDSQTNKCQPFVYNGCGGNINRFRNLNDCESICVKIQPDTEPFKLEYCLIINQTTNCYDGNQIRYYYNPIDGACKRYPNGICGTTPNNFQTYDECFDNCKDVKDLCQLPPIEGECNERHQQYYYNSQTNQCELFIYSGCGGNINRFINLEDCQSKCQHSIEDTTTTTTITPQLAPSCDHYIEQCKIIHCPYGIGYNLLTNNCTHCFCLDPCKDVNCPDNTKCAIERNRIRDNINEPNYVAVCRQINKYGNCPNLQSDEINCDSKCRTDVDCELELKCCQTGCAGTVCVPGLIINENNYNNTINVPPAEIITQTTTTTISPEFFGPKLDINLYQPEIERLIGDHVIINCGVIANPLPKIIWSKDDILIDITQSRYHIKSNQSLQIVTLHKTDSGVYGCTADNGFGEPFRNRINLHVLDSGPRKLEMLSDLDPEHYKPKMYVKLHTSVSLPCYVLGWPLPTVTWWKNDQLLPLKSDRYEVFRDHTLSINNIDKTSFGTYTCHAFNGIGSAKSLSITLIDGDDNHYDIHKLSNINKIKFITKLIRSSTPQPYVPPPYTEPSPHIIGLDYVPVRVEINLDTNHFGLGTDILLPCHIEGTPKPTVNWYKDGVLIDFDNNQRITISDNYKLIIRQAIKSDSGAYQCEAFNDYSKSSSTVVINVEGKYIHPKCTDNQFFARCQLIVSGRFCNHKYYAKFCCRSCTEAGQLPMYGPHLNDYNDNRQMALGSSGIDDNLV